MPLSDSSLQRRVKRYFNRAVHRLFIPCTPGLELLLHAEVESLLAHDETTSAIATVHGGVELTAHIHAIYHLNLGLRTGNRVLLRVGNFWANSLPSFFGHTRRYPWEVFLGNHQHLRVRVSSTRSKLSTGQALHDSLIAAINERLLDLRHPILPAEASDESSPTVYVRVHEDRVTISLDTSGQHLYKRGYRTAGGTAPIRPTTAAALILFSRWARESPLIDPFCGSGTIPLEAALLRENLPPGRQREFAFQKLPFHNRSLWSRLIRQADTSATFDGRIIGADIDADSIHLAEANSTRIGVRGSVEFQVADAMSLDRSILDLPNQSGALVMNLPYGKRVSVKGDPGVFARSVLEQLRTHFLGWHVAFALPRVNQDWNVVLQDSQVLDTLNGGIPIRFVRGVLK